MKLAGTGRILLWTGGSLWIGRAGGATDFHAHHAVQVSLSLSDASLRLRGPGAGWSSYRAALVAANQAHAFDGAGDFVANLFIEPESRNGQALQQRCIQPGICALDDAAVDTARATLLAAYKSAVDDAMLVTLAREFIATLAATSALPSATLDPRIERALDLIRLRIADDAIQLADIARAAHLSADRFRHLFLEQTGIRFRPYVLWLRIETALAAYAASSTLTAAAQAGGFADAAHFSRTFKSMFGIAPSAIQID